MSEEKELEFTIVRSPNDIEGKGLGGRAETGIFEHVNSDSSRSIAHHHGGIFCFRILQTRNKHEDKRGARFFKSPQIHFELLKHALSSRVGGLHTARKMIRIDRGGFRYSCSLMYIPFTYYRE